jgi:hypothetical protein
MTGNFAGQFRVIFGGLNDRLGRILGQTRGLRQILRMEEPCHGCFGVSLFCSLEYVCEAVPLG